jgi:hypothetical protein
MNAPAHSVALKRQSYSEDLTLRAFALGAGTLDGDDLILILQRVKQELQRLEPDSDECEDIYRLWEDAESYVSLAMHQIASLLDEREGTIRRFRERSDAANFLAQDNAARAENVRGA